VLSKAATDKPWCPQPPSFLNAFFVFPALLFAHVQTQANPSALWSTYVYYASKQPAALDNFEWFNQFCFGPQLVLLFACLLIDK
jgi:hypothetical protein